MSARLTTTAQQRSGASSTARQAAAKSDRERTELAKEKTGVFTGSYAINPVNGQPIPIWIADYVLISYGTGAIMAVPAHDTRDFRIRPAVRPDRSWRSSIRVTMRTWTASPGAGGPGVLRRRGHGDQLAASTTAWPTAEFKQRIAADLQQAGQGREAVNYKLRDWLFSRQRFWGEPFPILHELDDDGQPTGLLRAVDPDGSAGRPAAPGRLQAARSARAAA